VTAAVSPSSFAQSSTARFDVRSVERFDDGSNSAKTFAGSRNKTGQNVPTSRRRFAADLPTSRVSARRARGAVPGRRGADHPAAFV